MKIVADKNIPFIQEYFDGYGELILKSGRFISPQDLRDADILLVRSITHVDEKLLANTRVKFVGSVTAGADHLDTKYLDEAGIIWSVAAGFNAPPVADYVMSSIAALQSKNVLKQDQVKAAVIGVGNVGRLVVERMKYLNFDIILCDPIRAQEEKNFVSTALQDLSDLDFISLHVPLIKTGEHSTYHFIDKHFLKKQKPGCVLLNASRGSVVHSQELLEHGSHLHWCFDVWEGEPNINKTILEQARIATPHIAGYSVQAKIRGIEMIYRIACEKGMIEAKPISPIVMPKQRLNFSNHSRVANHSSFVKQSQSQSCCWQDIVLGVFNPLVITEMMRALLLPSSDEEAGHSFDEMRNQFNYRYEFGYTNVLGGDVSEGDRAVLEGLNFRLSG